MPRITERVQTAGDRCIVAPAPLPPRVRAILAPRKRRSLAEFAREIYVPEGPRTAHGVPVRYDLAWFPLQAAILDALSRPGCAVVLLGPPQCGKTLLEIILIAYQLFELGRPAFYFNAAADTALAFWDTKFLPTIRASPTLRGFLPVSRDEQGKSFLRRFTNGTWLRLAGSESPNQLAFHSSPVIVADDCQDMPAKLGERGHPIDLALKRQRAFGVGQTATLLCGTAGLVGDYHNQRLTQSTRFVPYLPCPACGAYQWLDFERLRYDEADPIVASESAYMECAVSQAESVSRTGNACAYRITHRDLPAMLPRVRWVSCAGLDKWPGMVEVSDDKRATPNRDGNDTGGSDASRTYPASRIPTRITGFWFSALYWPKSDWGALAAEWLAAKGNPDAEASFRQNTLVIPSSPPKVEAVSDDTFASLSDQAHRWGTIPREADCHGPGGVLLVTVDPGGGYVWWAVHAWRISDGKVWLVELGIEGEKLDLRKVTDKAEREEIYSEGVRAALRKLNDRVSQGWPVANHGEIVLPASGYVDRGYLPEPVDEFVANYERWFATFGSVSRRAELWPEKATVRGPSVFYEIGAHRGKLEYRGRFVPGSDGSIVLPGDMPDPYPALLRSHMSGEWWDEINGKWKRVGPNHYFDCGAMQIVAARHKEVRIIGESAATMRPSDPINREPEQRERGPQFGDRPFLATQRGKGGWR